MYLCPTTAIGILLFLGHCFAVRRSLFLLSTSRSRKIEPAAAAAALSVPDDECGCVAVVQVREDGNRFWESNQRQLAAEPQEI